VLASQSGSDSGFEKLSAINPRLVCSITGFGPTAPHNDKPDYDLSVQAWEA
jgi:crotonobetainyl-CoA:carnitine CoA-transferase CaiB-like acyl-CoA transferase